jgi:N-acetylglutamate synthase-like GNAT family acetyltransferase
MPVKIRPAIEQDQPTIRRLIKDARLNPMGLDWPHFVVAEQDGAVAAVGQVKTHGDGSRELASIVVVPARQGQGIGSAVIGTLLAGNPGGVLHLTCRRELQGYYERFGFRRLDRADYPPYFGRLIPLVNLLGRFAGTRILVMRREAPL